MEGPWFNTIEAAPEQKHEYDRKAKTQEHTILDVFLEHRRPLTPPEVLELSGLGCPLTSIRRAITCLTNDGLLEKLHDKRKGNYGIVNHTWRLKAGQLKLL